MNKIIAKLTFKEKVGYGLGDTASHFVWDMVGFWILIFTPILLGFLLLLPAPSC
jgi:Na+/melibiose symporter-like transporter